MDATGGIGVNLPVGFLVSISDQLRVEKKG
jgi:hypothetical protein